MFDDGFKELVKSMKDCGCPGQPIVTNDGMKWRTWCYHCARSSGFCDSFEGMVQEWNKAVSNKPPVMRKMGGGG